MARLNNNQVSAGIWFSMGVIIMIASWRYGLGSFDSPGTGFMPFLSGVAIFLFSLIGITKGTLEHAKGVGWKPILRGSLWKKSVNVLAALYAYTLLMNRAGFLLCTVFFMGFLLRTVKPQRWLVVILVSLLVTMAAYFILEVWLKTQLPKNRWGI